MNSEKFIRNSNGLLENPPVKYVFNEDGSVNWRKMVRKEFLVPNRSRTQETNVEALEDKDLLILLGGIDELAHLRGYISRKYNIISANIDYVCMSCEVTWIPNFETNGKEIVFQAVAAAHAGNTFDFASNYLAEIAQNRAFTRCVRNFLRINIVGHDEISDKTNSSKNQEEPSTSPISLLKAAIKNRGIAFEDFVAKLKEEGKSYSDNLQSEDDLSSIPKFEMMKLIKRLNKG